MGDRGFGDDALHQSVELKRLHAPARSRPGASLFEPDADVDAVPLIDSRMLRSEGKNPPRANHLALRQSQFGKTRQPDQLIRWPANGQ